MLEILSNSSDEDPWLLLSGEKFISLYLDKNGNYSTSWMPFKHNFHFFHDLKTEDMPEGLLLIFEDERNLKLEFPFYFFTISRKGKSFIIDFEVTIGYLDNFLINYNFFLQNLKSIINEDKSSNIKAAEIQDTKNEVVMNLVYHSGEKQQLKKSFEEGVEIIKGYIYSVFSLISPKLINDHNYIETNHNVQFRLKIQKELRIVLQQYLDFFTEFIEITKGKTIGLTINRVKDGLGIEISSNNLFEVRDFFSEYLGLLKQNIQKLTIRYDRKIDDIERRIFEVEMKNQIRHLENQLEIRTIKMNYFEETLQRIQESLPSLRGASINVDSFFSKKIDVSTPDEKKWLSKIQTLIRKGEYEKVLLSIRRELDPESDNYNEVLILENRYHRIITQYRDGMIKADDHNIQLNNFTRSLISILDEIEIQ